MEYSFFCSFTYKIHRKQKQEVGLIILSWIGRQGLKSALTLKGGFEGIQRRGLCPNITALQPEYSCYNYGTHYY